MARRMKSRRRFNRPNKCIIFLCYKWVLHPSFLHFFSDLQGTFFLSSFPFALRRNSPFFLSPYYFPVCRHDFFIVPMVAREELSPSSDRSIDQVAPPPLRSDSKFRKGKGAVSGSSLPIDRSVGTQLLASATRSHQSLLRDSDSRELPQEDVDGDCVVEGAGEIVLARANDDPGIERRSEGDSAAKEIGWDRAAAVDGIPDRGVDDRSIGPMGKIRRLTPFSYHLDGAIVQLLDLPSKLARPSVVQGQSWGDVLPTESTFRSVSSLMKECGAYVVEFIIPRPDQRL